MSRLEEQPSVMTYAAGAVPARWWTPAMTVQAMVLAGILGIHYRHVIERLISIWSHNGDWSHGFIIPLFSIYFLYMQRHRMPLALRSGGTTPRMAGGILLTTAFLLYVRSTLVQQEYPKNIALVMTVMGVVLIVCGWPLARWSWFAVAFLMFAMPVPQRLYEEMTMPLRGFAANISAGVLSVLPGMMAEPQGTVVEYIYSANSRSGTLDVEQACSGMRSIVAITALGVAMAFVSERPLWQRMIMILACVPIAVFCNIIRVTTTGFMVVFGKEELARGVWHTMLGLSMLVIAFGLYGGISYVLNHLFVDGEAESSGEAGVAV